MAAAFLSSAIGSEKNLSIGSKAPKIMTIEGSNVVADAKSEGKTTVVSFWTPKNPASRIANLQLSRKYGEMNEETNFISICTDSDDILMNAVMKKDGTDKEIHYSSSQLSSRVMKDYGVEENPKAFLIGNDGKIKDIL